MKRFYLLLLLTLFSSLSAMGETLPVKLWADVISGNVNTVVKASGNVVVKFKGLEIRGDRGIYDRERGILKVWGNVKVIEGETSLECKSLIYDLRSKRAVLDKVYGKLSPTDYIKADRLERISEKEWIAYDGEYTPCRSRTCPDWSVGAKKFRVLLGESFVGKWVSFKVKEIPVVWVPVLSGPIKRKRRSGFLTPKVGYVGEGGFYYKQPFYLVLGRSADLTVWYEKRFNGGNGRGGEFRYVLAPYSYGSLFFNDLRLPSEKGWKTTFEHVYNPSDYLYGTLHGELVNSRSYYKASTSLEVEEKTKAYTKSSLSGSKLWSHYLLNVNTVYLDNLDGSTDKVYQKLPNLHFYLMELPVPKTPFLFSFDGDFTYFYRKAGNSSYRTSLEPSLRFVKELKGFKTSNTFSYLLNDYQLGGTTRALKFENLNSVNYLSSISHFNLSFTPQFGFRLVNVKGIGNEVIYDLNDKVLEERKAILGGEGYFYRKDRELGRVYLDGGYDLLNESWGTWKLGIDFYPIDGFDFQQDFDFSFSDGNLESSNTYVSFPLKVLNGKSWINYYYQQEESEVKYLRWGVDLAINKYLSFSYQERYDIKLSMDRERIYSFNVNRGCWRGALSYRWVKNYDNSIDYQITLTVDLLKLGSYGYIYTGKKVD